MEKHFQMDPLDPAKLIKVNNLKEITNPSFFIRNNSPTPDGLLSNEIFGITKDERSNIFAYIDLGEYFIHPVMYKTWSVLDRRIREIIHGTKKYKLDKLGNFIEDENGETGIAFLRDNIKKINFKDSESIKRQQYKKFLETYRDQIFIKQCIVIPAYYRDVNTNRGYVGVGEINKFYSNLLMSVKSIKETAEYGLDISNSTRGRVQELLLGIYNFFIKGLGSNNSTEGAGIYGKKGILRRSILSKTSDYASRLVISAPNLRVETMNDMMVDLDHSAIPLASICANLFPYMIFFIRRFFENEFGGSAAYPYKDKKTKEIRMVKIKDPLEQFSDERIKHELKRFMKGYSNRFIPVTAETEEGITININFKGWNRKVEETSKTNNSTSIYSRRLTWCDVIYMAAVEAAKDKVTIITRFPMDSYFNQFPTKIVVSSTKKTVPMYCDVYGKNKFYPYYPSITEEEIGKNTSNKFIDTLNMSNLRLGIIGGDYDGDQVTNKTAYSIESNNELVNYMNSKANYVSLGGESVVSSGNEAIQSIYNLTLVLPDIKLVNPIF